MGFKRICLILSLIWIGMSSAIALNPKFSEELKKVQNDPIKALDLTTKALSDPKLSKLSRSEVLFMRGFVLIQMGRCDEAMNDLVE